MLAHNACQQGVVKLQAVCYKPLAIVMEMCVCALHERINTWSLQEQPQQLLDWQQHAEPSWPLLHALFKQAAWTLKLLHAQAILHNDLKPHNWLMQHKPGDPTGWQLKLCDFGLATFNGQSADQLPLGRNPLWLAPELLDGSGGVAPASDVWAMGECVLWCVVGLSLDMVLCCAM